MYYFYNSVRPRFKIAQRSAIDMFGLINTLMSKLDLVLEYITDIFLVDLSVSMRETNNLAL